MLHLTVDPLTRQRNLTSCLSHSPMPTCGFQALVRSTRNAMHAQLAIKKMK